jgi:hypothetical protein
MFFQCTLQVFALNLCLFLAIWKVDFKYLKVYECFFANNCFFFLALNIDVVNFLIYVFLSMEFIFIVKFIPNLQKLK